MKRIIKIIIAIIFLSFTAYSQKIDEHEARIKAQQFYNMHINSPLKEANILNLVYEYKDVNRNLESPENDPYFFIFNINSDKGFIIVSGEKIANPILAYSFENSFDIDIIPTNLRGLLEKYKNEIKFIRENVIDLTYTQLMSCQNETKPQLSSIEPLLGNIKWDQDDPYNSICPFDIEKNNRTLTGCVATAMAQVMKFHRWPEKGKGAHIDTLSDKKFGLLKVDFENTTYDWKNMPDEIDKNSSLLQKSAVAKLMYHCGISVNTNFSVYESCGYTDFIGSSFKDYFNYDENIQMYDRKNYSYTEWVDLLITELKFKRPILITGYQDLGHIFVCDGYNSDGKFHINWGWGGAFNGYFDISILDPLNPNAISSLDGYNRYGNKIIIGIQRPDSINKVNYQLSIEWNRLKASMDLISPIANSTFDVSFGIKNLGINAFDGLIGLGLFKNDTFQNNLATYKLYYPFAHNSGFQNYVFKDISLKNISNGEYELYAVYLPKDSARWSKIKRTPALNNAVKLIIKSDTARIFDTLNRSKLNISNPILMQNQAISGLENSFQVQIKNSGYDFLSNLMLNIVNVNNVTKQYNFKTGVTFIPSGITKSIIFKNKLTLPPGDYYAVAYYDSTNNFSSDSYKVLGPDSLNNFLFHISSIPTSINQQSNLEEIMFYPNPVKDVLNIQSKEIIRNITLFSLSGEIIGRWVGHKTVNISYLSSGFYILKLETAEHCIIQKIIKE